LGAARYEVRNGHRRQRRGWPDYRTALFRSEARFRHQRPVTGACPSRRYSSRSPNLLRAEADFIADRLRLAVLFRWSTNQHAITVTVKTVVRGNCMTIRLQDRI